MGVKYVLVEPDPPSWWVRNKTKVVIACAVVAVLYLRDGNGAADDGPPRPTPTPSVSATR